MSELVNRRTERRRAEIVDVAIQLFAVRGFDETSMSDVAEAAGVSRRTLYRYFETKDDLVFEAPRIWLAVLNGVIDDRKPGESTRDLCRRALLQVADYILETHDTVLAGAAVVATSPSLSARHGRSDAEWSNRYLQLFMADVGDAPGGVLTATTAALALVAAQNALIFVWAAGWPDTDLKSMTVAMLDQVDCLWPEQCR
ncbi:MAG: TetR family transcriptional regulator [Dehalococcoidia bacterium]|nr:TetR family transcriptional regulator [Dehalococcoidia bacterium]